jgi:type II secretory pathway pseudopilin PulG
VTGSFSERSQAGFTLLGLLFVVAGLGVAMAALGTMWHTAAQREKEKELLFIGNQYRQAIESFWNKSPGVKRLPKDMDELLSDPRFPATVRHLRRVYRDPMTGSSEWGLVKEAVGGISGVYSLSEDKPFKTSGFTSSDEAFREATSYREWVFRFDFGKAEKDAQKAGASAKPGTSTSGASQPPATQKAAP